MRIVFYISGHGLGHASRDCELIESLLALAPDLRIIVRTSVRSWVFDRPAGPSVEIPFWEAAPGMAQIDSLRLDEDETARRAADFYGEFRRRVRDESAFLTRAGARLVVGDIPPLTAAAAHDA